MRNFLIATSALAFAGGVAAVPASAADMLSLGVGGYMQQWFGVADRDDKDAKGKAEEGGWAAQADSEVHFKGALESDAGLKFTVHVELEGDRGSNAIDESYARVSGGFGQVEFGARDHAMVRMHSGISDVGIGLTAGDTQKWVPGTYLDTYGHAIGNARKLNYISPRVSGLQVGVSYAPDDTAQDANTGAPSGNDNAGWGAAVNFKQEVGDMAVTFSLGHKSTDSAGSAIDYMPGMQPAGEAIGRGMRLTPKEHTAHKAAWEKWEYLAQNVEKNKVAAIADDELETIAQAGVAGRTAIMGATESMTKGDAATYTNAGVGVSFGAFKFNVAYATSDGGAYKAMPMNVPITQAEAGAISDFTWDASGGGVIESGHTWDHDGDSETPAVQESADNDANGVDQNDPSNDTWMSSTIVEDKSKNADVWGVSVTYTDGPMALSLGHMTHEDEAGGEREATMFSASYTLAPGVAWKSSVFGVEDTTGHKNVTGGMNEGTGFVTGITLSF